MDEVSLPQFRGPVQFPDISTLSATGVYFLIYRGIVVYVGQARSVRQRVGQHISEGRKTFDAVSYHPCDVGDLDALERRYILQFLPKYNQCQLATQVKAHVESKGGDTSNVTIADIAQPHDVYAARFLRISVAELKEHQRLGHGPTLIKRSGRTGGRYPASVLLKFAAKHLT